MEPRRMDANDLAAAVRAAMEDGPLLAAARVERAIRAACPEIAQGWAVGYVARLVADGRLPEKEVADALERFRRYRRAGKITNPAAYLAAILRERCARHGQPWRNTA